MFSKAAPQHAIHSDGFSVFIQSREAIGYEDSTCTAELGADLLCGIVPLYTDQLRISRKSDNAVGRDVIVERIVSGLEFLGVRSELVTG